MTQEQTRMAVYNTIANYLTTLQQQNEISATLMEDAINKYLVGLKDQMIQDLLLQIPEEETEYSQPVETEYEQPVEDGQFINELSEEEDWPTGNHMVMSE